jgi:AraC-like DNA-binding protein/mannose-6-phosphate isomerase-like protein (cupin superfamily)
VRAIHSDTRYICHLPTRSCLEVHFGKNIRDFHTDWHFHREWQFVFVTEGERRIQMRDGALDLRADELLILPPGAVHRGRATSAPASFQMFNLADGPSPQGKRFRTTVIRNRALIREFTSVTSQLGPRFARQNLTGSIARRLASLAVANFEFDAQVPKSVLFAPPVTSSVPSQRLIRARCLLDQHLSRPISLEELAGITGYSRYHFLRRFRETFGLAPKTYHLCARLLEAKRLLALGDAVCDVALQLGFSDQSHLGRNFRRVFGLTPGSYRDSIAN